MIKRIITGIIVGTALMFVGRSMPKALEPISQSGPWGMQDVDIVDSSISYTYSLDSDRAFTHLNDPEVGYIIDPTLSLGGPDNNMPYYPGWEEIQYNAIRPGVNNYYSAYFKSQGDARIRMYSLYKTPLDSGNVQTPYTIRLDTQNFPFTVSKHLVMCSTIPGNPSCFGFYSEGDLPTVYQNGNYKYLVIHSKTILFGYLVNNSNGNVYYRMQLVNNGDKIGGNIFQLLYNLNQNIDVSNAYTYYTNTTYTVGNTILNSNEPLGVDFNFNWSLIDSANEYDSEYGTDKKVTSYSVAFEVSPLDLESYDYYYTFITDMEDITYDYENWNKLTASDKGIGVIANLKEDGYVVANVVDSNGNVVGADVFNAQNIIGKTMIFPNDDLANKSFFNSLINDLDYGGPISSIMLIPPRFINGIYTSFGGTCSPINLSLLNKNITFNCISLNSFLGNNLVNTLDIIFSAFVGFGIFKFLYDKYDRFTNLENIDTFYNSAPKGGY